MHDSSIDIKIGVVGLGYVGLPVAVAFAEKYKVVGFDTKPYKIDQLINSVDPAGEIDTAILKKAAISYTSNAADLSECNVYIIAVPTPVDENKVPDLKPLQAASKTVGHCLKKGDTVIFESTVFPGCTEEECVPILEASSSLKYKDDFKVGYSPERINPGDKKHTLKKITKIVAGCDKEALSFIAELYDGILEAGVYKTSSIKVAEAAKVIENTQRDVNIALVNELAIIFDRMDINTSEVLAAAGTKWNFLKFQPGLVGGHCIGVDPYYLTFKSKSLGYDPIIISSARKINDYTPLFISEKIVRHLLQKGKSLKESKILVKGFSLKENVSDTRNTKVIDMVKALKKENIKVDIYDPNVDPKLVQAEYGLELLPDIEDKYDVLIMAVSHDLFLKEDISNWQSYLTDDAILFDVKSKFGGLSYPEGMTYLNL